MKTGWFIKQSTDRVYEIQIRHGEFEFFADIYSDESKQLYEGHGETMSAAMMDLISRCAGVTAVFPPRSYVLETKTQMVLDEVNAERVLQDAKWGEQNHPDVSRRPSIIGDGGIRSLWIREYGLPTAEEAKSRCKTAEESGNISWPHILTEEVCEAIEEACSENQDNLRVELIQVAAVATAWVEAIDRRKK